MRFFYVTLVGPLLGYYIRVKAADTQHLGLMLNGSKLKRLWCAGYTLGQIQRDRKSYGLEELLQFKQDMLDYDYNKVEEEYKRITGKELPHD